MIQGVVTEQRTAVIPLTVQGTMGQVDTFPAIVDTGFNGFLTLPLPRIAKLGFPYRGSMRAVLGNGKEADMDVFAGTVLWDGQVRAVMVLAADGTPLVGMGLLDGSRVLLHVTDKGTVSIDPLP